MAKKKIIYPKGMDLECAVLCDAVNLISGIITTDSCCGHNERPYRIWFVAENLEVLPDLLYWLNSCHSGDYNWNCQVITDCSRAPVRFLIEGPVGDYEAAYNIAKLITKDQAEVADGR
jgi:hypothetical protein